MAKIEFKKRGSKSFAILLGIAIGFLPFFAFASGNSLSFTGTQSALTAHVVVANSNYFINVFENPEMGNGNLNSLADTDNNVVFDFNALFGGQYWTEAVTGHLVGLVADTTDPNFTADCGSGSSTIAGCTASSAFIENIGVINFNQNTTPDYSGQVMGAFTGIPNQIGETVGSGLIHVLALLAGLICLGLLYRYCMRWIGSHNSNSYEIGSSDSYDWSKETDMWDKENK